MTERWRDRANCRGTDPEAFFPDETKADAIVGRVCARCRVKRDCLEEALAGNVRFGYWGGLSTSERERLRADRLREAS